MKRIAALKNVVLLRYLAASALALGVDIGAFLALLALGVPGAAAAAAGYTAGIAAHWLLSSRAVFQQGVAVRGPERTRQKAMFVGSALFGLALTTAIVGTGEALGSDPRLAKLLAIAASFTATWLLREKVIFRPQDTAAGHAS
ncbi:GtrA family protein [Novosphingobium sp.]|uniref:GtrA family protein n=1 Tax=Novosphingobium sp. TaxID=1874826 RepID=UPI0027349413|nr:GtrA family protein [Novosphingobium sp.]MDP3906439.1 GtrA family protein [Novosphingobium sp.]